MGRGPEVWLKLRDQDMQTASYENSHRDVKYSYRDIVNNIVITVYRVRWVLDLSK